MCCIWLLFSSCSTSEVSNNVSDNTDIVYTVNDCPALKEEIKQRSTEKAAETETKYNSAAVMVQIMDTLENNFKAAGFEVVRDGVNHITIK